VEETEEMGGRRDMTKGPQEREKKKEGEEEKEEKEQQKEAYGLGSAKKKGTQN